MKIMVWTILISIILTLSSCGGRGQDKEPSEIETTETEISEDEDGDMSAAQPQKEQEKVSPDEGTVQETEEEIDVEKMSYVDILEYARKRVLEVLGTEEYQNGDASARVEMLEPVLERLQEQGIIVEYRIKLERGYIAFDYAGGGGSFIELEETPWYEN